MQLSLAFCQAPRVAFNEKGAEEPYGWESREYLRKMLIGQVVKFKVLYKVDAISRSFASLEFKGKDVLRDVVEKGMVSVRSERDDKGQKELYESLLRLQSDARSAHRGIWGDKRVLRSVNWTLADPESFFKANKGLPLVGIVEQVRDGSTFRLYLPDTHDMIMLHLAGVQSPRITYSAEGEGTFHGENVHCISDVRAALAGIAPIFGAPPAESQRRDFHRRHGQIQRILLLSRIRSPCRISSVAWSTRGETSPSSCSRRDSPSCRIGPETSYPRESPSIVPRSLPPKKSGFAFGRTGCAFPAVLTRRSRRRRSSTRSTEQYSKCSRAIR